MTVQSIGVPQSCNLLTHFYQTPWHSLCIRISEHYHKKEKDRLKPNQNQTIFLMYLKQSKIYLPHLPWIFWRSSIHLRLRNFCLISQKEALEFSREWYPLSELSLGIFYVFAWVFWGLFWGFLVVVVVGFWGFFVWFCFVFKLIFLKFICQTLLLPI